VRSHSRSHYSFLRSSLAERSCIRRCGRRLRQFRNRRSSTNSPDPGDARVPRSAASRELASGECKEAWLHVRSSKLNRSSSRGCQISAHLLVHLLEFGDGDKPFGHATLIARDYYPKAVPVEQSDRSRHSRKNIHLFPTGYVVTLLRFPINDSVTV
jgi:hypothetical protein